MDNPETSTILDTKDTIQDKQNENAIQKTKNMTDTIKKPSVIPNARER